MRLGVSSVYTALSPSYFMVALSRGCTLARRGEVLKMLMPASLSGGSEEIGQSCSLNIGNFKSTLLPDSLGFLGGAVVRNLPAMAGDAG